jgi:RNA polymerase sigma factor (sigma-70 family)
MAAGSLGSLLHHLRRMAGTARAAHPSDGQLLERFARDRDEAAFAALVARHGPLVWGVCQRVLRHEQDAEDAFQATFLVLARRAAALDRRGSVGGWLHTVAYRLAVRARAAAARREFHERQVASMARVESRAQDVAEELRPVLDEELSRLPEKYRAPLVLCYLQDRTHAEASRELGWPAGSLSKRLARGRKLLRGRLERRGITLAGGALGTALSGGARGAVPAALARATVRASVGFVGGAASGPAAAHARGMLRAVLLTRLRLALAAALVLAIAAGVGVLAHPAPAIPRPGAPQQDSPRPVDGAGPDEKAARTDRYGDPLPAGAVTRLGTVRFRHGQWVRSLAFSPDGKLIASASADHTIRLWDRASGREVRRLTGHQDAVNFVAFTAGGKQLISASGDFPDVKDASVRVWEVETGRELRRLPQDPSDEPLDALALSPDGTTLAAGVRNQVGLMEVPSGRVLGACRLEAGTVNRIRFSPDGKSLAAVFASVGVCLFDLKSKQLVWENKDQPVDSYSPGPGVAFAPDGQTVAASISIKQPMRLLDAATGKEVRRFEGEHNADWPLVFSSDGKRIFSDGWGQRGIIWDAATGKPAGTLDPPLGAAISLTLSPDGKVLAEAADRAIRFWDSATGKGIPGPEGAQALISALAVSPDGKSVLTASHFDTEAGPRVWDLATGRQRGSLAGHQCAAAAFAPDGKTLVAGCFEGTPVLADAATGKKIRTFEGASAWVDSLAFTPDGKRVIGIGLTGTPIRVWDPATGKELAPVGNLPVGSAKCLALAPDGKLLATGGMDKVIRLWDVAARKEVRQLTGQEGSIWALTFSPDDRRIAAVTAAGKFNFVANGTDRAIRVWDVATGRIVRTLTGPAEGSWSAAWSPDGRVLATGGEDHEVRLWEVLTWQERIRLPGHEGPVSALAFTADGTRLISGSSDTTALVWDLGAVGRPTHLPAADDLPGLWADLADADAGRAFRAVAALAAVPDQCVPLLREKVRPVAVPEPGRLARLVANLDDAAFAVRERAERELEGLGELAAPALKEALEKNPSAELRRRAERLLDRLAEPPADQRAGLRAVEVLERAATPEARQLLERLARGAPVARLSREARAALDRLSRRTIP